MLANEVERHLPPLFKRHVRRPRLTKILDASRAQAILIIAPAGYGKTTLVAEWLQGRDAGLWYRATSASADVAAFSVGVIDLIEKLFPSAGKRVRDRVRVSATDDRMPRTIAELLAEDVRQWPSDKWLVLDDYHTVAESTAVEDLVDWLLTLTPLRIVVTTRTRPAWASARRVLYGESLEITRDQLALTDEEARDVLGESTGTRASSIVEQAQGWPALVGLAALAGEADVPEGNVSAALYRYFAEEILRQCNESGRATLLRLSALPSLDSPYLAALEMPAEAISAVLREQPLTKSEGESSSSRLHPLLQSFLLERFAEEQPSEFVAFHQCLIERARDGREWATAFELATRIGDMQTAVSVACDAGTELLATGRHETLDKWLRASSPAISDRPDARLLHAETLLRRGSVTEAYGLASEVSLGEHDLALLARAWRLKGKASYWLGENERALTEQSKAIELASDSIELHEALWGAFLAAQQVNRADAESFLDHLEASDLLEPSMHLRLAVGRSVAGARSGSFRGAHDLMEATAGFLERTSDPEVRSSFLAHWSYVEVNRSRYERAHVLAEDAAQHARLLRLGLPLHASLTCRALAEIGMRKFGQASRTVAEMKRVEVELPDPTLRLQTLIVDLKLRLSDSDRNPVIANEEPQLADPSVGEFIALRAMAAAVADDPRQAYVLASDALSVSSSAECWLYAAFAKLIADRSTKATDAMTQELLQIVTDAFDRQCLDAYVIGYRACPELLGYALSNHELREFTKEAVSLARDYAVARDAGLTAPALEPLHELLTKRELEVFGLVCQGLTNKQIAEHLVVSPTTAKVHVYHIMKKLGVKSRMEAILHFGSSEP